MAEIAESIKQLINSGVIPNPVSFVTQLVSTLILFYFLKKWVWVPMTEFLEKRRQVIVDELESARILNEEAAQNRAISEKELTQIKQQAAQMIEEAKLQAEKTRQLLIEQAEIEAERLKQQAKEEIERDRQLAQKELKTQVVDLAFELAEKLIQTNISPEANQRLVEDFIKEVGVN